MTRTIVWITVWTCLLLVLAIFLAVDVSAVRSTNLFDASAYKGALIGAYIFVGIILLGSVMGGLDSYLRIERLSLWALGLGLAFTPIYWKAYPPRLPVTQANGVYKSACCGAIILKDGILSSGSQSVRYVIEDRKGAVIIPEYFVGVDSRSQVAINRQKRNVMMLRLDVSTPHAVEIYGDVERVRFVRQSVVQTSR
jgi:hypothetical protein